MKDRVPWFDDEDLDFWRRYPDGTDRVDNSFDSFAIINEYSWEDSVSYVKEPDSYY